MSSWSIAELNESDVEDYVECELLAFVDYSLHGIVYPNPRTAVDATRKAMTERSRLQPGNEIVFLKAIDAASGQIIGGIKCCYYGNESVRSESPYASSVPETDDTDAMSGEERYRSWVLARYLSRRVKDLNYPHALIEHLFVHPEHQRRGVGRELVARTCSTADERGLPAVVEASPVGKRTYELGGFTSKELVTITDDNAWPGRPDHLYYWMERKPPTA